MPANSIDCISTSSPARIGLALLLTVLIVFPDGVAVAQSCNTKAWTTSSVSLAPPGSPSYYGVETFAAVVATAGGTNFLYVIGGENCNTGIQTDAYDCSMATLQTQVGYIQINSDGSLGTASNPNFNWESLWSVAKGDPAVGLSRYLCGTSYTSSTGKTYIYTIGGLVDNSGVTGPSTEIHFAQIDGTKGSDLGKVESWSKSAYTVQVPTGAAGLELQGTAVVGDYLYVIGGSTVNPPPAPNASELQEAVYSAALDPMSGDIMAPGFTLQSQSPIDPTSGGDYKTCPVVNTTTNTIYVAGGETGAGGGNQYGPATTSVWYATQGSGGALSQWAPATSLPNNPAKTYPLASQAVAFNGGIILMGGDTTGEGPDSAYVDLGTIANPVTAPGTIKWTTSTLPNLASVLNNGMGGTIERNAGATSGNFIYSLGGEQTISIKGVPTTSDSTAIYCLELPSS